VVFNETRDFKNVVEEDSGFGCGDWTIPRLTTNESREGNYKTNIYFYDGVGSGSELPSYFEDKLEVAKSLPALREAFVEMNPHLPFPSYCSDSVVNDLNVKNICVHIRKGDAIGTRILDNDRLIDTVRHFQNTPNTRITIHSNGDVGFLENENTVIMGQETDVLQVLSDFIHADVLVMNYSSLSIAAHLLAKPSQTVICPTFAGTTFFDRILEKCIKSDHFLGKNQEPAIESEQPIESILANRTYSWQNDTITFLQEGRMRAFGDGTFSRIDNLTVRAEFGGRVHYIHFDNEYSQFNSVREDDSEVVNGQYLDGNSILDSIRSSIQEYK
jgi:hypothetical protein